MRFEVAALARFVNAAEPNSKEAIPPVLRSLSQVAIDLFSYPDLSVPPDPQLEFIYEHASR
jgi:hypothetical protein